MKIKILAFGKIADILPPQDWEIDGTVTAGAARQQMEAKFPALKNMRYLMAVDKKVVAEDTLLSDGAVLALLPPFSGG